MLLLYRLRFGRHPSCVELQDRVRPLNGKQVESGKKYVLYWTQMNRRTAYNQALDYAVEMANSLDLPLLVYEGLTCGYPYANDRIHTFMLEAAPETAAGMRKLGAGYAFYLRRRRQDPNDVFYEVAADAAAVVTDDYPTFIPSKHNGSVPAKLDIAFHAVDASCVVPANRYEKREYAAYTIRPKLRRMLPQYLKPWTPPKLKRRWKGTVPNFHTEVSRKEIPGLVASCEIDHSVAPSTTYSGGYRKSRERLDYFLNNCLRRYAKERNEPSAHATSNLSPYLHFGHISALEVALLVQDHAKEHNLIANEFLEELIVRRELSFNFTRFTPNYTSLECLPDWARENIRKHAKDKRPQTYTREQIERGETYDDLWNATQQELLIRGKIHGYYRMYWGKKIIEWSPDFDEALETMIYLHDRYSLDGRDPNTYTNILWCFGLHDRAWAERPVFGKMRYMSYEGMRRKTDIGAYIQEIADLRQSGLDSEAL